MNIYSDEVTDNLTDFFLLSIKRKEVEQTIKILKKLVANLKENPQFGERVKFIKIIYI
jgi:hypothetical protein